MVIDGKLTDEQLIDAIYNAAAEYEKLLGKSFLLVGKNKKTGYFWFECCFEKKNFMHLLGIKSNTLSATAFLERCISHNRGEDIHLTRKDCTPSRNHNRTTINEKSSCCAQMLRIQDAKYMNIGSKDKISQFVDFSYAYGNEATLGFQHSSGGYCFPITLIPRSVDEFTTKKYRIIFVFVKAMSEKKYPRLLMEIKKGIFAEHYAVFPEELKIRINDDAH